MTHLTDDEAALLYHVQMFGSEGYPIQKIRSRWMIREFRSWTGFPVCFKTKKAATERFELWVTLALDRFRQMRAENENVILTAVGIRG